jgi:CLIP-associating protein 1/2
VVNTLKTCLRTSNSQLYTPAVATIHSFLKLIERSILRPDTIITRQLLTAFLPAGGVIDRLGDPREKTRENSRNIIATIGYLCYNSAGGIQPPTVRAAQKAIETPLAQFERLFREVGFGSKIWRVREQVRMDSIERISRLSCPPEHPNLFTDPSLYPYLPPTPFPSPSCSDSTGFRWHC